jgi:hypothetical protein
MTLKARRPAPTSKASGASGVKENAPPVSASAEALLLTLAVALASAFVAALLSLAHVVAPGPPPPLPEDFGFAYAASNVLYFFVFTGPPAALGGLAAGLALAAASSLRRR